MKWASEVAVVEEGTGGVLGVSPGCWWVDKLVAIGDVWIIEGHYCGSEVVEMSVVSSCQISFHFWSCCLPDVQRIYELGSLTS